jgi:hypothetical protein
VSSFVSYGGHIFPTLLLFLLDNLTGPWGHSSE